MDSWVTRKEELKQWMKDRYWWTKLLPVILVTKNNWFATLLTWTVGTLLTGREAFRKRFATTIGPLILIPKERTFYGAKSTITHEVGGHGFQFWACGLFIPYIGAWIGIIPMLVFYGLLLPIGFNWFRYRLELHADVQKWKWLIETQQQEEVMSRAESFAKTVGSKNYGWPVPQSWALWGFKRKAKQLLDKDAKVATW